jgi:carboxymethylenebutenolidase
VLHETFGLNDDMRRIARRFADNGYVAMAPDLFSHGNKAICLSRVIVDLARGAGGRTLDDLIMARNALAGRNDVDPNRIAVAGFCMGGSFALILGTKGGVKATAVNYGAVPKAREELDGVCPVVARYGALDSLFTGQGRRLEEHLTALGVPHDVKFYDGVGHSFLSYDNGPAWLLKLPSPMHVGYSEAEAEDAWARMLAFFSEHVR